MKQLKTRYLVERLWIVIGNMIVFCILFLLCLWFVNDRRLLIFIFAAMLLFLALSFVVLVLRPYMKMNDALKYVLNGYAIMNLYKSHYVFSKEIESIFLILEDIINTKTLIDATKKQAEYLALQNQINPHFLYNTLESIRAEAIVEDIDSVAHVTQRLANFYRYTISNVDRMVTIQDELSHIEDYIEIQKFRFGDKINLFIEVDKPEYLKQFYIPKIILQPIVENAVYHGLERKVGPGNIRIRFIFSKQTVNIIISDDGVGMNEQELLKLKEKLNTKSINYLNDDHRRGGIALVNVSTRIDLLYGEDYGLSIYSVKNGGTDVDLYLPLVKDSIYEKRDY